LGKVTKKASRTSGLSAFRKKEIHEKSMYILENADIIRSWYEFFYYTGVFQYDKFQEIYTDRRHSVFSAAVPGGHQSR
jgi:hypothetical protein